MFAATAAGSLNFLTSESAESASLILLKLKALPCNCLAPAIVCLLFEVRTNALIVEGFHRILIVRYLL